MMLEPHLVCRLQDRALHALKKRFDIARLESVTSLNPVVLQHMASPELHVGEEVCLN